MTTILDSFKTNTPLTSKEDMPSGSDAVANNANNSSDKTPFSEVIEQSQASSNPDENAKKSINSIANNDVSDTAQLQNKLDQDQAETATLEQTSSSPVLSLVNTEVTNTGKKNLLDNPVIQPVPIKSSPQVTLESQATNTIELLETAKNGNKLPRDGQIQPVPPTIKPASIDFPQVASEDLNIKSLQLELRSNPELIKGANINGRLLPASAQVNHQQATAAASVQPIEISSLRILNQGDGQLISPLLSESNPLNRQQILAQNSTGLSNTDSTGDLVKGEYLKANKPEVNFEQLLKGDVKLLKKNVFSELVKTDVLNEAGQTASAKLQQPVSTTSIISTNLQATVSAQANQAKPTTMMMQTSYSADSKQWSESFARNIALMTVSKNNLAEIRMDPPDLGSIQVKISHTANETNLQFQVNHQDTKQAIEASIQRLKESLAEQGFSNVNVDIQHGEQPKNHDKESNQLAGDSRIQSDKVKAEEQTSILQLQQLPAKGIDFFA